MGFRLASLRRQTNVVMAPACTCINFNQDFLSILPIECFGCCYQECCCCDCYCPPSSIWFAVIRAASDSFRTCTKQLQHMYVVQIYRIFVTKKTDRHVVLVNCSEIFGCVVFPQCLSSAVLVLLISSTRYYFNNNNNNNNNINSLKCYPYLLLHESNKCSFVFIIVAVVSVCIVVRIMNNSVSMGDDKIDMGLQKIDMPTFEGRNLTTAVKDKRCPPTPAAAIDLLSNFEHEICRNGTNFQQDCEEFLKLMAAPNADKTSNSASTTATLINGGTQSEGDESHDVGLDRDSPRQVDEADGMVGLVPREEKPEVVDHMSDLQIQLSQSQSLSQASSVAAESAASDASSYVDACEESRKRCLQMERRIERLARRLKLQQSKMYGVHTSEQISGLLDFCRCKFSDMPPISSSQSTGGNSSHSHYLQRYHHSDSSIRCKTTSTTMPMDVYLKRLKRCSDQSCVPKNSEKFLHYFGSGTKEGDKARNITSSVAPKLSEDLHEHIEKISGQLHAQVKVITNDFDSDVTASSSGNDSLDEESPLTPETMEDRSKKIPLNKRALWRWLRHRASIAYRLSWLQSHMSALEYTIHHYTEIHKKLRSAKGQVVLENDHTSNSLPSMTTAAKNGVHSIVLNGFHGSLVAAAATTGAVDSGETNPNTACCGSITSSSMSIAASTTTTTVAVTVPAAASSPRLEKDDSATCCVTSMVGVNPESGGEEMCSRTCPLLRSKFRRRNLIRLDTWQGVGGNNAAASASVGRKFASLRCDCVPPLTCVLCVRRGPGTDLSNQHIYANLLPVQSKIALLEPTYHPVLSFPSDVSVSTHISALLNNEDVLDVCAKTIESRTATQMSVKRHYSNYKSTEEIRRANSEGLEFKRRRKYARRQPNSSQAVPFGRSQLSKQRHSKLDKTLSSFRKRRRKKLRTKRPVGNDNGLEESADEGLYYKKEDVYSSQPGSPHSSHSSTVKDPIRRKRGQSYDIDNFIIPPNSTPAVVASKPQYKEILIPRWSIVEEKSFSTEVLKRISLQAHIMEDLSDEHAIKMHEMSEQSERKKFRTNSTRNRTRKRTDSCPETSEANTPERMTSPVPSMTEHNDTTAASNDSIAITNAITSSNQMIMSATKAKNPPLSKTRTTSIDCDNASVTAELSSTELVAPYEIREFPLSDEAYKEMLTLQHGKIDESDQDDESTNDSKIPPENQENRRESTFGNESVASDSEDPDDPDWMLHKDEVE